MRFFAVFHTKMLNKRAGIWFFAAYIQVIFATYKRTKRVLVAIKTHLHIGVYMGDPYGGQLIKFLKKTKASRN